MKFILSLALLLTLAACEVQETKDENKNNVVNETDYTVCHSSGNYPSNPIGSWQIFQTQNGFHFRKIYRITNDSFFLTHQCDFGNGAKASASVGVQSSVVYNGISLLSSAKNAQSVTRDGYELKCQAELSPGVIKYRLEGRCLVLSDEAGSEELALVPVE
ncbi:MAG: hypothetical protein J7501_10825 [Bdellovibrio sp.]|nr:hypothetical protein [Bdellovibrio sp.]